jgi:hypothetical protein
MVSTAGEVIRVRLDLDRAPSHMSVTGGERRVYQHPTPSAPTPTERRMGRPGSIPVRCEGRVSSFAMDANGPGQGDINPYAAPATSVAGPDAEEASALDLTRDEVRSFVGEKHRYYWGAWQRSATKGGFLAGFNGAAFFFNMFWLLYRKMHREFCIGCGAMVAASGGLAVLGEVTGKDLNGLDRVVNVAAAATVGMLGNGLYLRRARRVITTARVEEADPERRMQLLTARGGTSILRALAGAAGTMVIGALIGALASR